MSLIRWSPLDEMNLLRNQINTIFEENLKKEHDRPLKHALPIEVSETSESYCVKAMVPGINPDMIQVETSKDDLTITADLSPRQLNENEKAHFSEFKYGKMSRYISFAMPINTEKVEAKYEFGILTITLPKQEAALPKRIEIKTT